jgi:thiamine-phosphate pyrophosphorylase
MTISEARNILGSDAIIGSSCYSDLDLAHRLCAAGADYVAFGSVFDSPTKPDAPKVPLSIIADACKAVSCQVAAIGGITTTNAQQVVDTGAGLLAVISGLWATNDPAKAAAEFSKLITRDRIPNE